MWKWKGQTIAADWAALFSIAHRDISLAIQDKKDAID